MGSGMFAHLVPDMFGDTTGNLIPGMGRQTRGPQMGPNGSGWSAPSLAGANAGYGGVQPGTTPTAGGPNYYAANPYVYAARQATGQ